MRNTSIRLVLLALAVSLVAGCIERPPSIRARREGHDRSNLGNQLLTALPAGAGSGAVFGGAAELVKVEVSPATPAVGDRLQVSFYFRALEEADEDYKIFVHVDDPAGKASRVNGDHWPAKGKYPTGVWRKGEVIRDDWSVTVPENAGGQSLELWTGFYLPGKTDRWPVTSREGVRTDGSNRVLAATVKIR